MCSVRRAAMRTPENLEGGKHYERVQFRRRLRLRLRLRKLDYHHTSALRVLRQRRRMRMLRDNHHHPSALLLRLRQQLRLRREARRIRLQIIHIKLISRAKKRAAVKLRGAFCVCQKGSTFLTAHFFAQFTFLFFGYLNKVFR